MSDDPLDIIPLKASVAPTSSSRYQPYTKSNSGRTRRTREALEKTEAASTSSVRSHEDIQGYINQTFRGLYTITDELGSGAFGTVYLIERVPTSSSSSSSEYANWPSKLALKVETVSSKRNSTLSSEAIILQDCQKLCGFPKFYKYAQIQNKFNLCFIQHLGASLETLFQQCHKQFSIKTTLIIGMQLLNRLQDFHERGYIYRDLKPENCLLGPQEENRIYLIDFGICERYRLPDGHHIPYTKNNTFSGSYRYASMRQHRGDSPSRRDDLESLGFLMIYFLKGRLPWQRSVLQPLPLPAITTATAQVPPSMSSSELCASILKKKQHTSLQELCRGTPDCMLKYMTCCRNMGFDETPDYKALRTLLLVEFRSIGESLDYRFDWTTINSTSQSSGQAVITPPSSSSSAALVSGLATVAI
jgi:casein kinase 1